MPLISTFTTMRLPFPQFPIQIVFWADRVRRLADYNDYFTVLIDFNARDTHARSSHGFDGPGDVLQPEC
jgi:hypothetical protein